MMESVGACRVGVTGYTDRPHLLMGVANMGVGARWPWQALLSYIGAHRPRSHSVTVGPPLDKGVIHRVKNMDQATVKLGAGRDETYWTALLHDVPLLSTLPDIHDIVLLAPHPDDEVLACGGLLQRCSRRSGHIELWMVTDGEACFNGAANAPHIGSKRRREAGEAHKRLGINVTVRWLSLPDTQVANHQQQLRRLLKEHLHAETTLVAPLPNDGHPDNDFTGAVAYELAAAHQLLLLQYPIWMWHSGTASQLHTNKVVRLSLTAAEEIRKREAIAAFESQVQSSNGQTVLPRSVLRHFRRSFEVFFVEDFRADAGREPQR